MSFHGEGCCFVCRPSPVLSSEIKFSPPSVLQVLAHSKSLLFLVIIQRAGHKFCSSVSHV